MTEQESSMLVVATYLTPSFRGVKEALVSMGIKNYVTRNINIGIEELNNEGEREGRIFLAQERSLNSLPGQQLEVVVLKENVDGVLRGLKAAIGLEDGEYGHLYTHPVSGVVVGDGSKYARLQDYERSA